MSVSALLLLIVLISIINGLDIVNISSPVRLTRYFTNASFDSLGMSNIYPIGMTYYISPNDEQTNTKYLYYETYYGINDTTATPISDAATLYVKSDIFTTNFTQYNDNSHNLPLTVEEIKTNYYSDNIMGMGTCTNPVTNDILNCWKYDGDPYQFFGISCNIFHVKTNTFSDTITISDIAWTFGVGVLCFNDSYFISYSTTSDAHSQYIYAVHGALIDLNDNLKYNQLIKNDTGTQMYSTKGGFNFDQKKINPTATDLFAIIYKTGNYPNNMPMLIHGLYGYYTNINDTQFPVNIYNDSMIANVTSNGSISEYYTLLSICTLDFTEDCCWIQMYHDGITSGQCDIYILITDIYGNQISIKNHTNSNGIQLLKDVDCYAPPSIVDLPMISHKSTRYFAMFYVGSMENITYANIYCLQKDNYKMDDGKYNLVYVDTFETAKTTTDTANMWINSQDTGSDGVYNIPETNDIYITWIQIDGGFQNGTLVINADIYGQTFEIK